jgi:L-malate glycosyltransferase
VLIAPRSPLLGPLVRRVLRAADLVTVPGEHMRAAVERLAPGTPVLVFQYGVEADRLAALAREGAAAGGPLRIASARPLLALYRIDLLLDALAKLRAEGVAFRCDIAGNGPERPALERRAAGLGIADAVRFHGALDPEAVYDLLARTDVAVSVAESDGVSLALLEALALGAIPVLSDIPANRAWTERGAAAVLVESSPTALADGIRRAAALGGEEARAANLALVREHADLETNLGAFEDALAEVPA